MALFRALETARPKRERLFEDPFAKRFLGWKYRAVVEAARIPAMGRAIRAYIDRQWPGARASGVARTRWIDDELRTALCDGAEQVVILGAGFDTRGYRMEELRGKRVIEVDHPNTMRVKRARLAGCERRCGERVTRVPVDLSRDSLEDALRRGGYDRGAKTVFLWEGVTNYLLEAAVRRTLGTIADAAPGSWAIFTYVHSDVLRAPEKFAGGLRLTRMLEAIGEQWTFGLNPAEANDFVASSGLRLIEDVGSVNYRARYMGATGEHMRGYEFYRVAVARTVGATVHA
jgi:methyltransferase (TIGR00027 family)